MVIKQNNSGSKRPTLCASAGQHRVVLHCSICVMHDLRLLRIYIPQYVIIQPGRLRHSLQRMPDQNQPASVHAGCVRYVVQNNLSHQICCCTLVSEAVLPAQTSGRYLTAVQPPVLYAGGQQTCCQCPEQIHMQMQMRRGLYKSRLCSTKALRPCY